MQRQEALPDGGIEGRILAEMLFRRGFLEPEVQDGVRSGQGGGGCRHVVQGGGRVKAGGVACADGARQWCASVAAVPAAGYGMDAGRKPGKPAGKPGQK